MKFWKNLFKSDYDRGRDTTDSLPQRKAKTDLRAVDTKITVKHTWTPPPQPISYPEPHLDPSTRREGRPRRIYRGRHTPTKFFDDTVCSTFSPNAFIPSKVFEEIGVDLKKQLLSAQMNVAETKKILEHIK